MEENQSPGATGKNPESEGNQDPGELARTQRKSYQKAPRRRGMKNHPGRGSRRKVRKVHKRVAEGVKKGASGRALGR